MCILGGREFAVSLHLCEDLDLNESESTGEGCIATEPCPEPGQKINLGFPFHSKNHIVTVHVRLRMILPTASFLTSHTCYLLWVSRCLMNTWQL